MQALLRLTHALSKVVLDKKALITEGAAARMALYNLTVSELVQAGGSVLAPAPDLEKLLKDLSKWISHAGEVNCDLRGLRLNILRIVCGLSRPQLLQSVCRRLRLEAFSSAHGARPVERSGRR